MNQEQLLELMQATPTAFDDLPDGGKALIANLVRPSSEGFTLDQVQLIDQWFLVADQDALDAIALHNAASPFQVAPIHDKKQDIWLIPSIIFTHARPPAETYAPLWPVLKRLKFRRVILGDLL